MRKKILLLLVSFVSLMSMAACSSDNSIVNDDKPNQPEIPSTPENPTPSNPSEGGNISSAYFGGKKVLVTYFSWGGTTKRMAEEIQRITEGDIFEIVPENPYLPIIRSVRRWLFVREITTSVLPSRIKSLTSMIMMWCLSVVQYGGILPQ